MSKTYIVVESGTYSVAGQTFGPGRHECFNTDILEAVEQDALDHVRVEVERASKAAKSEEPKTEPAPAPEEPKAKPAAKPAAGAKEE